MKLAIANLVDSRADFYEKRKPLVAEELGQLDWLRSSCECMESEPIRSKQQALSFVECALAFRAQALVIHLPIWADPIFSVMLAKQLSIPILLMGNDRPETSAVSMYAYLRISPLVPAKRSLPSSMQRQLWIHCGVKLWAYLADAVWGFLRLLQILPNGSVYLGWILNGSIS
jgi:hypothetical protein